MYTLQHGVQHSIKQYLNAPLSGTLSNVPLSCAVSNSGLKRV